jgi:hypothetical protein
MAQEDFLKHLWRVLRHSVPAVVADNGSVDASAIQRWLAGSDLWLTPKTVEDYDPGDFASWPDEEHRALDAAVGWFRAAAAKVPPDQPATPEQSADAAEAFVQLIGVIQPVIRDEWVAAVEGLIGQAVKWAEDRGWANQRSTKTIEEPLLGKYDAAQLLVHIPEGRFILTPVTRFVAGGKGLVDFYAMPGLGGRSVVRREPGWVILPGRPNGRPKPWSAGAFEAAIRELAREAA